MKVGPQALAATMPPRDHGKPTKAEKADKPETGGLPPGLVRVQAKLEDIAAAERTQGQSNALDRVSRNLARYAQNQGIAAPTTPPAPTTAPTEPTATTDASTGTTGAPITDTTTTPAVTELIDAITTGDGTAPATT